MATKVREKVRRAARFGIDHPKRNEVVESSEYTLRISAPEDLKRVEVAIDQGEWQPCRQAVGYWWYDWSGYGSGEHEVVSRVETSDGKRSRSEPHDFFVKL